jgi:asparagine synthetase B (glutamine-hydrolysing)
MSAWGVEPRATCGRRLFLDVAMNLDPEEKMIRKDQHSKEQQKKNGKVGQYIDCFDTPEDPYLLFFNIA